MGIDQPKGKGPSHCFLIDVDDDTDLKTVREKQLAAETAAELVESGMTIGLGTGSTVLFLLAVLARRRLTLRCVASSPETKQRALELGLRVDPFDRISRLDLAIDGADQITPDGWLNKGRGRAHTREKVIAAASDRFVIIADSTKWIANLHGPVPLELLSFGLSATANRLEPVTLRYGPLSPDGGVIADYEGKFENPRKLAVWLESVPGLVAHGLFPPELVSEAYIARGHTVERFQFDRPRQHSH